MVVHWLTNDDLGRDYITSLREAAQKSYPEMTLSLRTADGVEIWVKEIDDQVRYITAQGNPELMEVIRTGRIKAGADTVSLYTEGTKTLGGQTYNAGPFKKALGNYRRLDGIPPRVIAPDAKTAVERSRTMDVAVTHMFSYLNGRPTNYLSRSPVFREEYWSRIANYLGGSSEQAAREIVETATAQYAAKGITRQQLKAIKTAAARRNADGVLQKADIDNLAKDDALEKVKDLLYETSNKSHLWDAMRIAAPFGAAWAEVFSTWARISFNNPKVLDRLAHGIHGAQQQGSNVLYEVTNTPHDSDQGFFFKDPSNGEESFAWPMPPQAQSLITMGTPGTSAGIQVPAPVGGLNLIGQVQPGFGPIVTAPANKFLNQPGWKEDVLNFIAPFGGPSAEDQGGVGNMLLDTVTPAYLKKFLTAVYPVTASQKSQLMSATNAAQVYLASTKGYDLSLQADIARMEEDAKNMARRIYFLRAIGQFILPTIGSPEQAAYTGNGELVLQTKLSAILRQYQDDPGEGGYGYQEGFIRFLRDFGTEPYLLGADASDSKGYMAPTHGTYDWMREHPDLMHRYEDVWGLLVDNPGTEFYYPAYLAQVREGFRTLTDPGELVEQANARIGRALYTSYRNQYDEPDERQAAELRALQDQLELQFHGYQRIPESGFTTPGKIDSLEQAAFDPDVAKLPVAASLQTYFNKRKEYNGMGISDFRTGTGREVAPELWSLGTQLAAQDPTFKTAWDRLLSYEFDSAQFEGE
jgi:hypothetical protein